MLKVKSLLFVFEQTYNVYAMSYV